jgi:CDP-diacylglycerol--glycerol-3-phosphate 3-phosphatidyltransferase
MLFSTFMTFANQITILRILLIPVFIALAIYYGHGVRIGHPAEWQRVAAIVVFAIASASDGLDGYIARRFHQRSRLGVVLDPIADKGLLLGAILTLTFSNWAYEFPIWFPVLVIARDVVVVAGTILLHYFHGHVEVRPSWAGKTATVMQMAAIAGVMLQIDRAVTVAGNRILWLDVVVAIAGGFTLVSGAGYLLDGLRQLHAGDHSKPHAHS